MSNRIMPLARQNTKPKLKRKTNEIVIDQNACMHIDKHFNGFLATSQTISTYLYRKLMGVFLFGHYVNERWQIVLHGCFNLKGKMLAKL